MNFQTSKKFRKDLGKLLFWFIIIPKPEFSDLGLVAERSMTMDRRLIRNLLDMKILIFWGSVCILY